MLMDKNLWLLLELGFALDRIITDKDSIKLIKEVLLIVATKSSLSCGFSFSCDAELR